MEELKAGMNAKLALARDRARLKEANARLICGRDLWEQMRALYAGK